MGQHIIVVGAGICGVSTAIWLRRAGHRVTLVDKGKPGMGASYGNAGLLARWAVAPVTSPALWRQLPSYIVDPRTPLFLKWSHLPKMAPWIAQFMRHATDRRTKAIVAALDPLVNDAVDQHRSLVRGTPLEAWIRDSKTSFVYNRKRDFDRDAYAWAIKADIGIVPEVITGAAVQDYEPILSPKIGCLAVVSGQGHITNPGSYVTALADYFIREGGQFVQAKVQDFTRDNGRITAVETDQGPMACDKAVITSGIWSKELMPKLGLNIPMEAERGYHVIFENPSMTPKHPMLMASGKFGVNAMDSGLRCAGTVELGNHIAGPSDAPLRLIHKQAAAAFPKLRYSGTQEWLGFRPSTPDSTPVIGALGETGIYVGFGHQHVGLTSGPKTGRILAQLIAGQSPNLDMRPYDPARFD